MNLGPFHHKVYLILNKTYRWHIHCRGCGAPIKCAKNSDHTVGRAMASGTCQRCVGDEERDAAFNEVVL